MLLHMLSRILSRGKHVFLVMQWRRYIVHSLLEVPKAAEPTESLHLKSSKLIKSVALTFQTILGEIRDEEDEILPRKDYEVRD